MHGYPHVSWAWLALLKGWSSLSSLPHCGACRVERSQPICPPYKLQLEECLSAEQVPTAELIQGYVKKVGYKCQAEGFCQFVPSLKWGCRAEGKGARDREEWMQRNCIFYHQSQRSRADKEQHVKKFPKLSVPKYQLKSATKTLFSLSPSLEVQRTQCVYVYNSIHC